LKKIIFILLASSYLNSGIINTYGQAGYINTPSAYLLAENSYAFIYDNHDPIRKLSFTASPFNWLDANIFYVDIGGKEYGNGYKQSYKDKGFNIKFKPFNFFGHNFAIGLNDFAGTGLFQSEYLVFSNRINNFEYSFGMGWGSFSKGIRFKNPLITFDENFRTRSKDFTNKGGDLEIDNYFSGSHASVFFGASYNLDGRTKLLFELDPTDTEIADIPYKDSNTIFNFGFSKKYGDFLASASITRGNSFDFQLTYQKDSSKFNSSVLQKRYEGKVESYTELNKALEKHNIGLKNIQINDELIEIQVTQNSYFDQNNVNKIVTNYARDIATKNNFKEIIVTQYYLGMKMNENSFNSNFLNETSIDNQEEKKIEYVVEQKFPLFINRIDPVVRNYFAGREGFYHGALFLENNNEIILNENLVLISNLKYSLYDNFDDLRFKPLNTYPEQVRSDNKNYYNEFSKRITIGRMELDYFKSFSKYHYLRASLGIFEEMFGGVGIDYVYSPEKSIFSYGLEYYHVKKRDYKMRFNFQEYENQMLRFSIQALEPKNDIRFKLSVGEYLAGDIGYTFTASKNFSNGVEFSAFFSRTDVSKELFGEGSFDKGIIVRIPFKIFSNEESLGRYVWRPLTKDPASLLVKHIDLFDEVQRYRFY
jgi:hypothetical protein